jgi:hypothetical protein
MGRQRWFLLLIVSVGMLAGAVGASGAAAQTQVCDGPLPPTQSGRVTITPGLNASKAPQHLALNISLFSCSPARSTRGAGTMKSTITIKAGQTCSLLSQPHTLVGSATITWKDELISTFTVRLSLSGSTHNIDLSGKVTKGLFKNHPVSARFHFADTVSGQGGNATNSEIVNACKNKVVPNHNGRVSINGLTLVTTKELVIT